MSVIVYHLLITVLTRQTDEEKVRADATSFRLLFNTTTHRSVCIPFATFTTSYALFCFLNNLVHPARFFILTMQQGINAWNGNKHHKQTSQLIQLLC